MGTTKSLLPGVQQKDYKNYVKWFNKIKTQDDVKQRKYIYQSHIDMFEMRLKGHNYKEIGREYDLTDVRVHAIVKTLTKKIRQLMLEYKINEEIIK